MKTWPSHRRIRQCLQPLLLTALAALLPTATAVAQPGDADGTTFEYYDIRGTSSRQLVQQMAALGPVSNDGKRFDAYTRWNVAWNFRWEPHRGGCEVTSVSTTFTSNVTMPRWANASQGSPTLVAAWERYYAALHAHELNHVENGRNAQREIERKARGFRIAGDCSGMEAAFNREANAAIRRANDADTRYDQRTAHGREEGVVLP